MYYALEWDKGSLGVEWEDYTTLTADTTLINVNGLSSGFSYGFRYKVQNIFGWSGTSPEISVLTMNLPSTAQIPRTSLVGTNIIIDWDVPYSGGSNVEIRAYDVRIKNSVGEFVNELTYCDGVDATIITNTQCSIPMETLRDPSSFNLVRGDIV